MSGTEVGWVWEHSPYKGVTLLVHLALADVVNDLHDEELFYVQANLAKKVRADRKSVNRALAQLVEDGFLTMVGTRCEDSGANRYRFERPDVEAVWVGASRLKRLGPDAPRVGTPRPKGVGTPRPIDPEVEIQKHPEPEPGVGALFDAPTSPPPTAASFDAFWNVYPRHVGKAAARKAWDRAVKRADVETILAGAGRYAAEVSGRDLQHVAHPTTWLNADRWDDEAGANRGSRGGATHQVDQDRTPGVRRLQP